MPELTWWSVTIHHRRDGAEWLGVVPARFHSEAVSKANTAYDKEFPCPRELPFKSYAGKIECRPVNYHE